MKTIAFGTLKGGTGKTTVAYNIGGILAEEHKVLFIDVDPQANLSDNAGVDTAMQDGASIKDVFENPNKTSAEDVITLAPMWQLPNLDIIITTKLITMKKKQSQLRIYVRPETTSVQLNLQSLLAASGDPTINNPSMPWGTQKRNFPWERTETQN